MDKARRYAANVDPRLVGEQVETIVMAIDRRAMPWAPGDPIVTDDDDFVTFDAEVAAAETDARLAGLLSECRPN